MDNSFKNIKFLLQYLTPFYHHIAMKKREYLKTLCFYTVIINNSIKAHARVAAEGRHPGPMGPTKALQAYSEKFVMEPQTDTMSNLYRLACKQA